MGGDSWSQERDPRDNKILNLYWTYCSKFAPNIPGPRQPAVAGLRTLLRRPKLGDLRRLRLEALRRGVTLAVRLENMHVTRNRHARDERHPETPQGPLHRGEGGDESGRHLVAA